MAAGRPWLVVSDIDDTLTGDPAALARLAAAIDRHHDRLWFAVNSSRPAASVAVTLAREFPPGFAPDAVVTGLGTEIALDGAPLPSWLARFEGWPHRRAFDALAALGHRPHAAEFQTPRKVSFAVPPAAQEEARRALAAAGVACTIIASGADDFDVIPEGAGKDAATLHLARTLGLAPDRVVAAGDSGNDLAMFRAAGRRIAVANARAELLNQLAPGTFYLAGQPHAAGVEEGLVHFGVLPRAAHVGEGRPRSQ